MAILGLTWGAENVPPALRDAAVAASISGLGLLAAFVAILGLGAGGLAIGRAIDRVLRPLTRRRSESRTMSVRALVIDLRARISDIVRTGWLQMTRAWPASSRSTSCCSRSAWRITGVEMFYGQVFAAYAIGRLLTASGSRPAASG